MIELVYISIVFSIFILISAHWILFFVKRIYFSLKYKRAVERQLKYDNSDYINEQYKYHFETEVSKYVLLLSISLTEVSLVALSYIHYVIESYDPNISIDSIYGQELRSCTDINNSVIIYFQFKESTIPLLTTLRAFRNVVDILLPGLVVCLMSYLLGRMKKSSYMNIRRYICVIFLISEAILLTSYYTFLIPISKSIYILVITYNYILFLLYKRRFKQALLHTAIELLVQHRSNGREMKQYRFFSYTINCISFGLCLSLAAIYLGAISRILIFLIFFGKCAFPTSFMPPLIELETLNSEDVMKIFTVLSDTNELSSVLACVGGSFISFPLILFTLARWICCVYNCFRKKPPVQFRFKIASDFNEKDTPIQ